MLTRNLGATCCDIVNGVLTKACYYSLTAHGHGSYSNDGASSLDSSLVETTVVTAIILDVSTAPACPQNGASLQLDALHSFAIQHHRLVLLVVKALVAIPVGARTHQAWAMAVHEYY